MPNFQVEMLWRCSACQSEVLGRFKACGGCGKPKGDELFYSAEDGEPPTLEAAVTNPQLIALATAGADWTCPFCRHRQSRVQKVCNGCGGATSHQDACASEQDEPVPTPPARTSAGGPLRSTPTNRRPAAFDVLFGLVICVFAILALRGFVEPLVGHDVTGRVASRSWKHSVVVERYQIVEGSGFAEGRPSDAFAVVEDGTRHHHYTQVPDGTSQQAYTQRVACGQDCRTTPVSCRSNNNGFKTCTGGDRVCSTRYCSEVRYRAVPRFQSVSVLAPWYTWRSWQWKANRTLETHGAEEVPTWPADSEVALDANCGAGEKERLTREASYEVLFESTKGTRVSWQTHDLAQFIELRLGATRPLHVDGFKRVQLLADPTGSAGSTGRLRATLCDHCDAGKLEEKRL